MEKNRKVGLPPDIPPLGKIGHEMDVRPPKWKKVQEVVRHADASSASWPNGVSDSRGIHRRSHRGK